MEEQLRLINLKLKALVNRVENIEGKLVKIHNKPEMLYQQSPIVDRIEARSPTDKGTGAAMEEQLKVVNQKQDAVVYEAKTDVLKEAYSHDDFHLSDLAHSDVDDEMVNAAMTQRPSELENHQQIAQSIDSQQQIAQSLTSEVQKQIPQQAPGAPGNSNLYRNLNCYHKLEFPTCEVSTTIAPKLFDESPKKNSERYFVLCKIPDEQRKVLYCVRDTYKLDLEGNDLGYDSRIVSTFGAFPRVKLKFNVLLEDFVLIRSNGNCSPDHANDNGLTCLAIDFLIASASSLLFVYSLDYVTVWDPKSRAAGGTETPWAQTTNLTDVGEGRKTVLSSKLVKLSNSLSGLTVADPKGYLTDLKNVKITSDAETSYSNKARLLLKSVIQLNLKHSLGWITAANMIVFLYKDNLLVFSRYLQRMESLGNKGGTDQHAYIQHLRDGVHNYFAIFSEVLRDRPPGHDWDLEPGVTCADYLFGMLQGTRSALYANGRESITVTVQEVTPRSVGTLVAIYERAVETNILKPEWRSREAATYTFGSILEAILEGPSIEKLSSMVHTGLNFLLNAMKDLHVKDTTAWILSRIFELLHSLGTGFSVITQANLQQILEVLLGSLGDAPHISEKVCGAIYFLAQGYEDAGTSSSMLASHLFNLIKCFVETADRTDGGDSKLRSAAYETLKEMVRCSNIAECSQIIVQVLPGDNVGFKVKNVAVKDLKREAVKIFDPGGSTIFLVLRLINTS